MSSNRQLWLLAGGNGAGKSTFYRRFLQPKGLPFVNADLIARQLDHEQPDKASYDAAILAGRLRSSLLEQGKSFCFETVFSHPSKIDFLAQARARRYQIILIYIHLFDSQLNQARVVQRVAEGGHAVPTEKIVSRIPRTVKYVRDALPLADIVRLYDNSYFNQPFQVIAEIRAQVLRQHVQPLPPWAEGIICVYLQ